MQEPVIRLACWTLVFLHRNKFCAESKDTRADLISYFPTVMSFCLPSHHRLESRCVNENLWAAALGVRRTLMGELLCYAGFISLKDWSLLLTCRVFLREPLMSITLPAFTTFFGSLLRNWSVVGFLSVNQNNNNKKQRKRWLTIFYCRL